MTSRVKECPACKVISVWNQCDRCGTDTTSMDDAVRIQVYLEGQPRTWLDYCHPCAVRYLPAAVGVGPGSDLPASDQPPEKT